MKYSRADWVQWVSAEGRMGQWCPRARIIRARKKLLGEQTGAEAKQCQVASL